MHIGIMRNTMSTCAQYGVVGVPITLFFSVITMYFLQRKSPTKEQLKAYNSLESFNYFKIGFVNELFVRTFDDVKLLIATVKRSYNGNTVNCWVITNLNGMVRSVNLAWEKFALTSRCCSLCN
jgi:hypothetical protein